MISPYLYISCVVIFTLCLTGCNPFASMRPVTERIQTKNWAPMERLEPIQALYCYRSIGSVSCYHEPQSGREDCLVGMTPVIEPITKKEKQEWRYKVNTFMKKIKNVINGDFLDKRYDPVQ